MNNVTINQKKYGISCETPVKLNNGGLVLHYNKLGDVMGAYIITSFRDSKNKYMGDQTSTYCSLVNLDTGAIAFEERCSRSTTIKRVLAHFDYRDHSGYKAVSEGQYIKVYKSGEYSIDITTQEDN